ncbi:arginine--tRNA ligase [Saccharothrix sp. NRRL B-16314]|uniref:arginine--tRNA ligase n=1 Tax=Saccharothrix sp. NRRL B-16314 TaxID=1463825 RepID=UPI000AFD86FE|nr:arginine--tRNA ligase [Saccharothrix sp. NRRL B-16314]
MSAHHQEVPSLLERIATTMSQAIGRVRADLTGADPVVRRSDRADFQCNAPLALAKRVGVKPVELAASVVAGLDVDGDAVIASVEPSGPGFLNVTVTGEAVWEQVAARLADARLGLGLPELGRRVVVDYSAPNIAKEMHVGHLRTTIIGDSLARVTGFLGADVLRQNHLGDFGTQFGMLIQYLDEHPDAAWHQDELGDGTSAVSALDGLYRSARAKFDADPGFADRSRSRVVALQSGDPGTVAVWQDIVAESERSFRAIYDRLTVLLTPEDSVGESFYNPMLGDTVEELTEAGLAVASDGALVFYSQEVSGPDGRPVTLMIRKRDGGYGYDATDLATIRYRLRDLKANRLIYVTDSRQALHFQLVFEAARSAGWLTDSVTAEHAAYGTILGPDGTPFKTRAGGTVRLMDLLDDAVSRARAVVAEKNPGLDAAELDRIAESAGIAAVKYADLSTSRVKDYSFDVDRMVSFTGNTGVYLQYAHARISSILRNAGDLGTTVDSTIPLEPAERDLGLALDAYGAVVTEVAATLEPHRLCGYLYELARVFTTFYEACPVLKADEPVRGNRLALCTLAARTLGHGLDLLGIAAPQRM